MTELQMESAVKALVDFISAEYDNDPEEITERIKKNPHAVGVAFTTYVDEEGDPDLEYDVQAFVDIPGMRIVYCAEWGIGNYLIVREDRYDDFARFLGDLLHYGFDDYTGPCYRIAEIDQNDEVSKLARFNAD